jgi:hypothetical protein
VPESEKERLDRELIELLNELRVTLPGVQVLFAFLLVAPFNQRFRELGSAQRDVYFASFVCTTVAAALLIAPTAYHRIRWREGDKRHMLEVANRLAIAGTVFLALAMIGVVYVVTDFLFSEAAAIPVTIAAALVIGAFWYALPLWRREAR